MANTLSTNAARVARLREVMRQHGVQAYIIPSEDAHQSEYIADVDGRRAYISGFTGSAGLAVVTLKEAALWTDGRYFLQASQQLDSASWTLMKTGLPDVPSKEEWLMQVLPKSSKVGLDPKLITIAAAKQLREALTKEGHSLEAITENLIDKVWGAEQPARPVNPVTVHSVEYAGKSSSDKIAGIREQIAKKKAWGFAVTALDEIAWLFNLRGSDIAYNPVFFAYALITKDEAILYVDDAKLSKEVKDHLGSDVTLCAYDAIFTDLQKLGSEKGDQKLGLDSRCSWALQNALGGEKRTIEFRSPVMTAKAIKNEVELEGFRQSHIRDAVALCEYFAWLEREVVQNGGKISEVEAADKLEGFRKTKKDFVGLSFDTISSTGPNGAIIHYKPEPETCAIIKTDQLYLCDSGAQYKDGTTDVTRTLSLNKKPTEHEKDTFTRVLKGHIQLDMAVFPRGTTGYILDVIARQPLWMAGLDFRHGTGHGVGAFLNVHEGPHGIGTRIGYNDVPLEAGMTITNEPGYYEDGNFGIRIENILLIRAASTPHNFGDRGYLGFEHVTLVPMQAALIATDLLVPAERDWLNKYHKKCWEKVSPLLEEGSEGWRWLKENTKEI
ncbi:peptidase M24, structural domain-containing protein [Fimicolochytrium jonesii]|uniref:peptidase M24, structural domain-containing protein n=1 Tax=Fimicolochytrium jonesii TaxID=1396493 RepID=UPI0022FEFF09|nr:peptidase M24, structural domain-containing protein [Fimicolochytrium jonesii]KAI8824803.1 peptidase M24, structural domain-containing protein [Fimicolochytrium jonesii]